MKRFDLNDVTSCGEPWREMEECADGDWVPWEDVEALIVRAEKAEVELNAAACLLGQVCMIETLLPGEHLAELPTHAATSAIYNVKLERDVAIVRAEKAETAAERWRREYGMLCGQARHLVEHDLAADRREGLEPCVELMNLKETIGDER